MPEDPEIQAMIAVAAALDVLEPEARVRVFKWAADRFRIAEAISVPIDGSDVAASGSSEEGVDADHEFEDLAGFYATAEPDTDAEKVLVSGFWLQEVKGDTDLASRTINAQLKNLGHQVGNMTRAFGNLMSEKPQLAIQVKKTGNTKQAPKVYRITEAGKRRVHEMLKDK